MSVESASTPTQSCPEAGFWEITPHKSASVYECVLLPERGLLGMSLDENRASHELRLQLPDGGQ